MSLIGAMDTITTQNADEAKSEPVSLGEVLRLHAQWMKNESTGSRCTLDNVALNDLKLRDADLQGAILRGVSGIDAELVSISLNKAASKAR
jgi:hypothetical protein